MFYYVYCFRSLQFILMPTYTFIIKELKKEFTDLMSISEMEEYLSKNKHISQVIQPIKYRSMKV